MVTRIFHILIIITSLAGLNACGGGGGDSTPLPTPPNVIGTEGGTYTSPDGVVITIPPGALSSQITLTVDRYADEVSLPAPIASKFGFAGGVHFAPDGLTFNQPVTIRIPLTHSFPAGAKLPLFYFTKSPPSWQQTSFVGTVNLSGDTLIAEITHFSTFTILYSELDSAALGLFDSFLEKFSDSSVIAELDTIESTFLTLFPLGDQKIYDLSWDVTHPDTTGRTYPDWWPKKPPPLPIAPPGYHCYETIGMNIILTHNLETFYTNPLVREYGATEGADFQLVYSANYDKAVGGGDIVADVFVSVLLRAVPPTMELIPARSHIGLGQSSGLTLALTCGGEPMVNQDITFSLAAPVLGNLAPLTAQTTAAGVAESVFTDTSASGGVQTIDALYQCCVGTDHPTDAHAITQISIGEYVEIDPTQIHLLKGEFAPFTATLRDGLGVDITDSPFLWSSSDPLISSVDPESAITTTVTATGDLGIATITATEPDAGVSATAKVLVGATVEINPTEECIVKTPGVSVTRKLTATVRDPEGSLVTSYPLAWSSSNESIALVDDTGNVAVLDSGTAQIQVKIDYPGPGDYSAIALFTMPTFPDDLVATEIVSEPYSSDLKLTNARNLVHLNLGDTSVKNQIVARAVENGWDMNPGFLHVKDINMNTQALVIYDGAVLRMDYNSATYTEISPPGVIGAVPIAMNDHGDVLLNSGYDAVIVYKDGIYTTITPPAPYVQINGTDMNNNGVIIGWVADADYQYGFIYKDGAFVTTELPLAPISINDDEQVILRKSSLTGYPNDYIYQNGTYSMFASNLQLIDINNFSDIYVFDVYSPHSIYHLCPLP